MSCPTGTAAYGGICLRPATVAPGRAHETAHDILQQRQFQPPHESDWTRFGHWVGRTITHALRDLVDSNGFTWLGVFLAALILAGVIFLIARSTAGVQMDPGIDVATRGRVRRRPVEWATEAARHEAAGEWRQALRCRYRALVAELATRGLVEEVPGRTTREYETQVRSRLPDGAMAFDEASDIFEAAWYGFEPSGPDEGQRFKVLAEAVLSERPR